MPFNSVEFVQTNNFSCFFNTTTFDLVFINPQWKILNNNFEIIGFEQLEPNFTDLLKQALELSQNIVICLPNYINLNEIARIIREFTENNLMFVLFFLYFSNNFICFYRKNERNSVEFEFIYFNKKLVKILMLLGNANTVNSLIFTINYSLIYSFYQ